MSGSNLTWGRWKTPTSAAPGGKSPVLLGLINKINDPILNLTPENITQHSGTE